jgi:PucR family transcriptional regulator, proline-responsive transcriptional activator
MKISSVIDLLKDFSPTSLLSHPDCEISTIEPFKPLTSYAKHTLYYMEEDLFVHIPKNINLLIQSGTIDKKHRDGNNTIMIARHTENVVHFLEEALDGDIVLQRAMNQFFEQLVNDASVFSLLHTAYEYLENPIVLTDPTYRLIGMFPEKRLGDRVWDKLLSQKYLEQDMVMLFETDQTRGKSLESKKPLYLNWSWAHEIPRLSGTIADGKNIYGYVGVLEYNRPFNRIDCEISHILCKVLCSLLKHKHTPSDEPSILKQTLLINLLSGAITSRKTLELAMSSANLPLTNPFRLLVIPIPKNKGSNKTFKRINHQLSIKVTEIDFITFEHHLVLFLYGKKLNDSLKVVIEFLKSSGLSFGISNPYEELLKTSTYYQQAVSAVRIGGMVDQGKLCYDYAEYIQQHLICTILTHETNKDVFIYPGVFKLIQYDKENQTEYAKTLYTYLQNYKNALETSKLLHIHRNTLSYRLNKCEDIGGFNLHDELKCRQIEISIGMLSHPPLK